MSDIEVYDHEETVMDKFFRGMNATQISKETGIMRKDVQAVIRQYHAQKAQDTELRDTARDALNKMVDHYDRLIRKFYDLVDEIDSEVANSGSTPQWMNQKRGALDSVAQLEAKRVDLMQKAGILDNNDLADEMAQMEEDKKIILDILRNDLCNSCRPKVMEKIGNMTGRNRQTVVVVQDQ